MVGTWGVSRKVFKFGHMGPMSINYTGSIGGSLYTAIIKPPKKFQGWFCASLLAKARAPIQNPG